jgi:hypothetical protein
MGRHMGLREFADFRALATTRESGVPLTFSDWSYTHCSERSDGVSKYACNAYARGRVGPWHSWEV